MPTDSLQDTLTYPHWMWITGCVLILLVIAWLSICLWRWRNAREADHPELMTISQAEKKRYNELLTQIAARQDEGDLDTRGVHLAVAGLMRALGTQRTGRDLEVATVEEIRQLGPTWTERADVLNACEDPSFQEENQADTRAVIAQARRVVDS